MKPRNEKRARRVKVLNKVVQEHEPGIRRVTVERKKLAAEVFALQEKDRKLRDEQQRLVQVRDEAVAVAREALREEEKSKD